MHRCRAIRRLLPLLAWVMALGVVVAPPAHAGNSVFDQYTLTSWTDEDGLFGGWIVGIAQDQRGYLWIGTVSGLLTFDGLRFERFQPREGDLLPQRSVSSVFASRDGSVWVGFSGSGGVCRIRDGRVEDFGTDEGLGEGRVTGLVEDADGVMLASTADGLFRFFEGRWQLFTAAQGLPAGPVLGLFVDHAGGVWASTNDAVYTRDRVGDHFRVVRDLSYRVLSLSEAPAGTIWATDPNAGYSALVPAANRGRAPVPARAGRGYRLLRDHRDNLWVATLGQGLWFVPPGGRAPQMLGIRDGLSNDTVRTLFEDRNGDVWAGTTVGLHRFARRRVTPITDLDVAVAVEADPAGGMWVGSASGVVRIEGARRRHYGVAEGLPSPQVQSLHLDRQGTLWVATANGLATIANGVLTPRPVRHGRWPPGVMAIAMAPTGDLWLCTQDSGVFSWRDGHLTPVPLDAGSRPTDSVFTDSQARLWVVLQGGGIGVMERDGRFRVLRQGDRFHRSELTIYEDRAGAVWFGAGGRLTRFKNGVLSAITPAHGLPAETIRAIVGDGEGHLWIGTSGGILRLAASEFDRVLADPAARLDFRAYNSSDGLAGAPVRAGYPNAARATDGRLWFVTGNGLTIVDPTQLSATRPAPPVWVERVTAGGRAYDQPSATLTLPPRTGALQIEYSALEFFSPRQVQFRYQLEGFDDAWIDVGSRRIASFTNLPPRQYRFRVIARSSEGVWNDHGAVLDFAIAPTFYQTRTFYGLCVAAIAGLVFGGWRLRLRQVRRQFGLVLTERARMAREIHDTLLQSLAGLELQVDAMSTQIDSSPGGVKQQLERVRRQIQSDVTEARQSIWDLRSPTLESHDLVTALKQLGDAVTATRRTRFEFVVEGRPGRCASKVEEHLLRVGREAVSNAVRHAQARVVRLELRYGEDTVTLLVSDDGCGFEPDDAVHALGAHWGMATMHERARAIGGRLRLESQPGGGTNLEMVAPLLAP